MRKLKRSLAVLLAVLVLITALPLTAFADEAAESPPMDTAASIDETVPDEPPISPEDNSGTVEASPPPSPEPSAEPDADENPDGTEDSTASEPDAAPTPDVSATQMPTPIPTPNPINLEYEYLPESETGGLFVFPAPYGDDLTQEYSAEHPAWDIAGDIGSPVVAANDGVVTQVQIWDGSEDETGSMSYGNMVQIKHGEELTTLYAHLSEINVQEGDTVVRGQRIGRIGDTGNATGAHLHFEFITSSGRKVSPDWLLASDIMPLLSPDLPYATVKEWCNRPNGTRTISDFGVTREEVIAELSAHVSDSYYLGTPYQGRNWQSPNGDPSYNGRAGLNCGGFVAYVLSKCGLNSGTSDLWTHSAGPVGSVQWYMTQNADITGGAWWDWDGVSPVYNRMLMCGAANYPLWVRNADLVAHTFATKADMLSSGVLEKGDIIVMIPKAASSSGFNDSHIGFFWGNSSSEDKMWHSDFSGNHISTITPKSPDNSFIVIKYGENTFDITLTKTSANVTITNKNPNYSLAGAVYNVYTKNATPGHDYSKDTVQATFTTDTNGKANLSKKLKDGDYAVKEITAPKGYVLDPTIHFVNISSGNTTLNVVDDPSKIKLTVVKKDAGTGQSVPQGNASLAGAVYEVTYKVNGIDTKVQGTTNAQGRVMFLDIPLGRVVAAKTTGKDGKILVENLRYGSYHYQEIEAPKGYDLDSTIYDFAVGHDGQIITVTRENTPSVGSISVCKVNSAGTPMSGVSFLLEFSVDDGASWKPVIARPAGSRVSIGGCDSSGLKDGVLVTGNDGIAAFTGLQIDNQIVTIRYRLTEIATRDGSTLMTTVLYDGSLPDVNGDTEITDVKITAVNNRNLELPNSGGSGFPVSSVGTVLIFIGLFFCVGSIRVLRKAR